jgi:uncharacterized repeat protein (TIGR03803 family)
MRKLTFPKMPLFLFTFCFLTAIALPAQTFTTLASFNGTNGAAPVSNSLVQGLDGNLYGVTQGVLAGNADNNGTVFKITPAGNLSLLYSFCSQANCADGQAPYGSLVLGTDGNFYGTTSGGGINNTNDCGFGCGTIFKITPAGSLTTLYKFCQTNCADGSNPVAGLVQGADGNFYGTTYSNGGNSSGAFAAGTIFKITPSGHLTTLYSFCAEAFCTDGAGSLGALVLAPNGDLYGTTLAGGAGASLESSGSGTVFRIRPAGDFTVLYSFCSQSNCVDGANPSAGLVLASNGKFYGTTYSGGTNDSCPGGCGTAFQVTTAGKLTTIHSFCTQPNCSDGASPSGKMIQATDGDLYGTATYGGTGAGGPSGTVFKITPANLTTVHTFCEQSGCTDGSQPSGALVQDTNGTLYGMTRQGGNDVNCEGCGTLYSLSVGLSPFVMANPGFGKIGQVVNILGNNLTGTTSVKFNGTDAAFSVVSSAYIKAKVPTDTTTGTIQVITPSGTLSSNVAFHLIP